MKRKKSKWEPRYKLGTAIITPTIGGAKYTYTLYMGDEYTVWQGSEILFEGNDFKRSMGADTTTALYEIAKWSTVGPGDTDDDFFKDYTPAQMAFAKSDDCRHMQMMNCEEDPLRFDRVCIY